MLFIIIIILFITLKAIIIKTIFPETIGYNATGHHSPSQSSNDLASASLNHDATSLQQPYATEWNPSLKPGHDIMHSLTQKNTGGHDEHLTWVTISIQVTDGIWSHGTNFIYGCPRFFQVFFPGSDGTKFISKSKTRPWYPAFTKSGGHDEQLTDIWSHGTNFIHGCPIDCKVFSRFFPSRIWRNEIHLWNRGMISCIH